MCAQGQKSHRRLAAPHVGNTSNEGNLPLAITGWINAQEHDCLGWLLYDFGSPAVRNCPANGPDDPLFSTAGSAHALAKALMANGDLVGATKILKKWWEERTAHPEAYYRLGLIYARMHKRKPARALSKPTWLPSRRRRLHNG